MVMHWIIKSKILLADILPIVDSLTNTLDAIDLTKEPKSTQGAKSKQWQLISVKDKDWIDLVVSEVRELEKNTIFQDGPILKVDSISMKGVNDLKDTIISLVSTIKFEQKSE